MPKLEVLSVAEDGHKSDRLSAKQVNWITGVGARQFYISVNTKREITVQVLNALGLPIPEGTKNFRVDIDGLIQYLQDVKTFLSEEDMIKELMGK